MKPDVKRPLNTHQDSFLVVTI